jgi:aryl-alcohol dehydrogenase-like predicted oxidoreductase
VTVGAAAVGSQLLTDAEAAKKLPKSAVDKVKLGNTSVKVSMLGLGTGSIGYNHQSNQTRLGQEAFTRLIRHAYDSGITFFDCADQYGSHPYMKEALKGIPRDKVVIQTKVISRDAKRAKADIDRFRAELGTDYIDTLMMHVVTEPDWDTRFEGVRDVISEAKGNKVVRYHGATCHGFPPLQAAQKSAWVEVNQARINPKGLHMDDKPEAVVPVLKDMQARGKGVIGMKIFGQGDIKTPEDKDASLRFALASGAVDAMVIGFESPEQIDDAIARINKTLKVLRA